MINNYCAFLRRKNEIRKAYLPKKLDWACLQLLDLILIAIQENKEFSVSNAMVLSEVGSPATIHKKLQILRDFDLVAASFTIDKRTKHIKLTKKARAYYDEIAKAFCSAP